LESNTLTKVEAESLFEAAIRGLYRMDSSFWTEEDVFDRMCITVAVHACAGLLPHRRTVGIFPRRGE